MVRSPGWKSALVRVRGARGSRHPAGKRYVSRDTGTHQVLAGRRLRGVELLLGHAQLDAAVALDALRRGVAAQGGGAASVGRGGKVFVSTSGDP